MKRDLNQLAGRRFDVLVVGGGIYGAAIAREAAVSGYDTALIEQRDFSHATSANSLKILHGGLRYLQDLDFNRMRASVGSQTEFMRIAPELVSPLGCIIPTYGYGMRGRLTMGIALFINDLVSFDRKYMFEDGEKRGRGRIVSKEEYSRIISLKGRPNFSGAALWYDGLVKDTERLTITLIDDAYEYGACIANYVKAKDLQIKEKNVVGALASDVLTGDEFEICARNVVNATGPWLDNTFEPFLGRHRKKPSLAMGLNVVVKKCLFKDYAIGLEGPDSGFDKEGVLQGKKRFFFFVPWRGHTMIGTAYRLYDGDPEKLRVERQDIEGFIREANLIYPPAELSFEDVTHFHAGLLPAEENKVRNPYDVLPAKRSEIIEHGNEGGPKGLLSVRSVKYTTAPHVAREVLKRIGASNEMGKERQTGCDRSRNAGYRCSHTGEMKGQSKGVIAPELAAYLGSKYGKCADRIQVCIGEDNRYASWISNEPPLLSGEIRYAIQEEMAIRLSDVVFRRTGFGNAACPSRADLESVADTMARELGWNREQRFDELESVYRSYHPLDVNNE